MSRTYRDRRARSRGEPRAHREAARRRPAPAAGVKHPAKAEVFRCRHCGMMVGPVVYGGSHRNHCPYCLYSRHVDGGTPGDRAGGCGSLMAPVGAFTRPKGEHVVVHRCLGCGVERHNRIAGDDDFDLVLSLPEVAPRGGSARPAARPLDATA